MAKRSVITRAGKGVNARTFRCEFDFGSDISSMAKMFGAEVVYNHALDNMVIALQAKIRGMIQKTGKAKVADNDVSKMVREWKPGVGRKPADPKKTVLTFAAQLMRMSPKEREAAMKLLTNPAKAVSTPTLRKKVAAPKIEAALTPTDGSAE